MLNTLSSNVVLAKARTKYGRRLTPGDYNELLKCRNVGEVAGYLKNHTVYSHALAGTVENEVHRGALESLLKQKQMEDYYSLCKYEAEVDKHFSMGFIRHDEIEYLLRAVLRLNSHRTKEADYVFPSYLLRRSCLNLEKLGTVKSAQDLREFVRSTPYEKLLEPFLDKPLERLDYTGIENALYHYLYGGLLKTIRKYFAGQPKKQLLNIYTTFLDLNNYVHIVRMKTVYATDAETAGRALLPTGTLAEDTLKKMLKGTTPEEIQGPLRHTEIGRRALDMKCAYLDEIPERMNFQICRHYIDFSIYPSVVLISYVFLSKTEIRNIITIIEGKRYQLAPEEIRSLLILEERNPASVAGLSAQRKE